MLWLENLDMMIVRSPFTNVIQRILVLQQKMIVPLFVNWIKPYPWDVFALNIVIEQVVFVAIVLMWKHMSLGNNLNIIYHPMVRWG